MKLSDEGLAKGNPFFGKMDRWINENAGDALLSGKAVLFGEDINFITLSSGGVGGFDQMSNFCERQWSEEV